MGNLDNTDELEHFTLEDAQGMVSLLEKALINARARNASADDIAEIEKTLATLQRKIASLLN